MPEVSILQPDANSGGTVLSANNGLTLNIPTNVQLGGTLIQNTQIACSTFNFTLTATTGNISFNTDALFTVYNNAATVLWFAVDTTNHRVSIGDFSAAFNGTLIGVADSESRVVISNRFEMDIGADVNSANDLILGGDGNTFFILGNTTINAISVLNWQQGSFVTLVFSSTLTVKNNTAGGAGTMRILLDGNTDLLTNSGDTITLVYGGGRWRQTAGTSLTAGFVQTANNGLTLSTPTNVQLGGVLVQNTTIGAGGFQFIIDGTLPISIGDISGSGNNTRFVVDDANQQVTVANAAGISIFKIDLSAQYVKTGDITGGVNSTLFTVDVTNAIISAKVDGKFKITDVAGDRWVEVDTVATTVSLGDISNSGNSTTFVVNDATTAITAQLNGTYQINNVAGDICFQAKATGISVALGDVSAAGNSTALTVNDSTTTITAQVNGDFLVQDVTANKWLQVDTIATTVSLGDISAAGNSTKFVIDDVNRNIKAFCTNSFSVTDITTNAFLKVDVSGAAVYLGDLAGIGNSTTFAVTDTAKKITCFLDNDFSVIDSTGANTWLIVDIANTAVSLGDITISANGTKIVVDDAPQTISIFNSRFQEAQGTTLAAANDLTLTANGNAFIITGNTTINAITTTNWQAGSNITLIFTGTPTVKNNTAGGAGTAVMLLAGSVDLTAANNTVLGLNYDGTQWQETFRKVA